MERGWEAKVERVGVESLFLERLGISMPLKVLAKLPVNDFSSNRLQEFPQKISSGV